MRVAKMQVRGSKAVLSPEFCELSPEYSTDFRIRVFSFTLIPGS